MRALSKPSGWCSAAVQIALACHIFSPKLMSMRNRIFRCVWVALVLIGTWDAALAQSQKPGIEIEFNKAEQVGADCRLIFKSTNSFAQAITGFSVEIYLLDAKGVALQSVQFSFGAIGASKARFAKFDLQDRKCADIGGIFVNEFKSCKADTEMAQTCRDSLVLKNLTTLSFTDGASP